jgi:hypothetical protein
LGSWLLAPSLAVVDSRSGISEQPERDTRSAYDYVARFGQEVVQDTGPVAHTDLYFAADELRPGDLQAVASVAPQAAHDRDAEPDLFGDPVEGTWDLSSSAILPGSNLTALLAGGANAAATRSGTQSGAAALSSSVPSSKAAGPAEEQPAPARPSATLGFRPASQATSNPVANAAPKNQAAAAGAGGRLSIDFEANLGQTAPQVHFLAHSAGYTLFLTATEAVMTFAGPTATSVTPTAKEGRAALLRSDTTYTATVSTSSVLRMELVGANSNAAIVGAQELPGKSNYFLGNQPSRWIANVPHYAGIVYQDIYPGIDLVYHAGGQQQLEYDWVVSAGADPTAIRVAYQGAEGLSVDDQGDLIVPTPGGKLTQFAPVIYQDVNGVRQNISGRFALQASGQMGFELGSYDRTHPLVIDPVVDFSTYYGGSRSDEARAVALGSDGSVYVAGATNSIDFPLANPYQLNYGGSVFDAFVSKLSADGSTVLYSTYLGGSRPDVADGIAVDTAGNAYVTGNTQSPDFPTMNALFSSLDGGNDAYVTELTSDGSALVYSTYLGGSANDVGRAIAVDAAGDAFVAGYTGSSDFPQGTNPGLQTNYGGSDADAFVAELGANGMALVYSSYLGGSGYDAANGIAVDANGAVYVTGYTISANFPVTPGAFQTTYGGRIDAFVSKIDPTQAPSQQLVYSTFLGGDGSDAANAIAIDAAGSAYVTGSTTSPTLTSFPVDPNAIQPIYGGGDDNAFVTKLTPDGSGLMYSTYLGGEVGDVGNAIAVDAADNAYVTGYTGSTMFPTTANALQPGLGTNALFNAFLTEIAPSGSALAYSSYFGGSGDDESAGIAVNNSGNVYLVGLTSSGDFPTLNAMQAQLAGVQDAFIAELTFP